MRDIDRRDFLRALGVGAVATALPQSVWAAEEGAGGRRRPNIVFLIADDERWDMMSCSGNKYLKTPNRDRLASEGMRFENAFVTSAVCSPSRGSFLTGKHVHQCGTQPIIHMNYTFHRNERPFPAQLHDVGYHTAHFGKWHLGEGDKKKPGYDHWVGYYALTSFFDPLLTTNNGQPERHKGFSDFVLADLASDHIRKVAKDDQPFCVYVGFGAPHYDFSFPENLEHVLDGVELEYPPSVNEDVTKSGKPKCIQNSPLRLERLLEGHAHDASKAGTLEQMTRRYMRSSLSLDESVGKVMQALEDAGVAEDTIIVYTSDHGHMLGEHGLGAKHLAYEESVRIPMIVRYPRMIEPGAVRDDLVANIDVAPTLLDLCGAPVPSDVAGRSMRPLFEADGKPVLDWPDDYAFLHETCVAVRTHKHKIIHYRNVDEWELYDLQRDPYEITNLYDNPDYAAVQADMKRRLEKHIRETGFPTALNHNITEPWLLGPFAAADAEAVVAGALAAPAGTGPVSAGGKDYTWVKPRDPVAEMLPEFKEARWMWAPGKNPAHSAPVGKVYFCREFTISDGTKIKSALVQAAADNHYELHINGKKAGRGTGWTNVGTHDVAALLTPGKNVIGFVGENAGGQSNPAGLLAGLRVELASGDVVSLSSGDDWSVTANELAGWSTADFEYTAWNLSQDLGPRTMAPWRTGQAKSLNPVATLGGGPDDLFLLALDIEVLAKRDPFVRLWFSPVQKAVTGWVNGERLYNRHTNGTPWNHTFNPPLVPGRNRLVFQGRLGDYPTVSIRVHGHEGQTRIPEADRITISPQPNPEGGLRHAVLIAAPWMTGAIQLRYPETLQTDTLDFIDHHRDDMPPRVPSEPLANMWTPTAGGVLMFRWEYDNQTVGGSLCPSGDNIDLDFWLENRRATSVPLALQFCPILVGTMFEDRTLERTWIHAGGQWRKMADTDRGAGKHALCHYPVKGGPTLKLPLPWGVGTDVADAPVVAVTSADSRHVFAIAWPRPRSILSNSDIPCVHADPISPHCAPGGRVNLRGKVYLLTGTLDDLLQRVRRDIATQ